MSNETLREQLEKVCEDVQKETSVPVLDGKYKLPDRRILIKQGRKFILVGHRDKKKLKTFQSWSEARLRGQLQLECYGGHSAKKLEKMSKDQMVRLIYPRPKQVFLDLWLTSGSQTAQRLKTLISKAQKVS